MEARLFFEFLQVAIGNRESLSRELSDNEWQDIFLLIKKHALLGVGFTAVERLHTKGIVCPAELRIKWYALAVHIERRNRLLNGLCKKVTEQYEHDGLSTCILKGQGNILNYPKELGTRRQSGDIDVWATPIKYLIHTENTEGHGCPQGDGVGERLSITDDRLLITDGVHTENTEGHGCPQADDVGEQELINDDRLFTHNIFSAVFIKLRKFLITDGVHTENTEGNGGPQADDGGEQELINDERLFTHNIFSAVFIKLRKFLITDGVHTENTEGHGCPQADGEIKIAVQTGKNKVEYHGHKAIREYVRMQYRLQGIDASPKACYHHVDAPDMDGVKVEVHYRPAFLRSPLRNRRMQRWFEQHADECMKNKTPLGFSMMTSSVNVVYQMCHLYTHIFEGGVGLRQLMDYYYTLKIWHNDLEEKKELESKGVLIEGHGSAVMSPSQVMSVFRSFGMAKFASAVMSVLHEVFAMPTHYYICEPNEKEGKRLMEEIMKGGNFGQYDTRDAALKKGGMMKHGIWKLKRVMRLVRSYPEEALWEPVFRVWHLGWRKIVDY